MAKKFVETRHQAFIGDTVAVTWYVKVVPAKKDAGVKGWVDAEFRAWDGTNSMYICDDLDTVERAALELAAYAKALRQAKASLGE